ncbi:hypothetical protein AKJ57_05120 [candidate division MSBL1 archaeon SCGC-AAA259A05]|uniref:Uncharacterized protein n=1 Tax=candidate division MSBL1 archaeon SCGC-AAA259A05 TaxID=1698259 RepID=A0A133U5Y5_9EURY|nr:hypothetical protein AKJ57_05120 [candidate division MSBL1 archaeon SCGC-AAA259A05]
MSRINREIREFVSYALESIDDPVMLLICGSTAYDEMTKFSDIDGTAFVTSTRPSDLGGLKSSFDKIAQERYGKTTNGGFYETHWFLFVYPKRDLNLFRASWKPAVSPDIIFKWICGN